MPSRFALDTAVTALGQGRLEGRIDHGWWIERGPNGGYVAALLLRALTTEVGDSGRTPRSFTVHYVRPPVEGAVEIEARIEREGRSMSTVSARMTQDGKLVALALAAFGSARSGPEFCDLSPPNVPPPEALLPPEAMGPSIPMRDRYEMRWAIGQLPFTGAQQAVAGGWLRLVEPEPIDHHVVAALTDAWMPPIFSRSEERLGVPTVDLTIHFRGISEPLDPDWTLTVFRSQVAAQGYIEEDGEVWSRDGVLLAQSRQLAVVIPAG